MQMIDRPLRIAVDAMGGDLGPLEVVKGIELAARKLPAGSKVIVVGDADQIGQQVSAVAAEGVEVFMHHAPRVIGPSDRPSEAFRPDCDASVAVSAQLVRSGDAEAFVSIGNTGAAMAASLRQFGAIPGIDRPAIATVMPTLGPPTVMLDMGATVDCEPEQLLQFAVMGLVYCRTVLGRPEPRLGLLSNGEEPSKGNDLTKRAHKLLKEFVPEFVGNIEAGEAFRGRVDVVVCDGFDGNVVLKCAEGVAELVLRAMREELSRHPWTWAALLPLRPALRRLRARLDYREFGGAPLLGVNGVCIVGHGRSDAVAVSNAIRAAQRAVGNELIARIERAIEEVDRRRATANRVGVA